MALSIPWRGWSLEVDNFHTSARNFLDHDVIGNSGIFIPLTDLGAIISGTEIAVRSPRLFRAAQLRIAYSNQMAQGIGPITRRTAGRLRPGNFLLDHDQRNTLTAVLSLTLPKRMWMTPAYQFGSGFLNGEGPAHLPPHSTFDLSIGKRFGENWTVSASAVNIGNARYLLDNSNTFGGTHYVNRAADLRRGAVPVQVLGKLRVAGFRQREDERRADQEERRVETRVRTPGRGDPRWRRWRKAPARWRRGRCYRRSLARSRG